jgi:hypothetical protein
MKARGQHGTTRSRNANGRSPQHHLTHAHNRHEALAHAHDRHEAPVTACTRNKAAQRDHDTPTAAHHNTTQSALAANAKATGRPMFTMTPHRTKTRCRRPLTAPPRGRPARPTRRRQADRCSR